MKNKRLKLKILNFLGLRCKKKKIPLKDSIRPCKVKSCYPKNWKKPVSKRLSNGEVIVESPISNLVSIHHALETWKKEMVNDNN